MQLPLSGPLLLAGLIATALPSPAVAPEDPFARFDLPGGGRLVVLRLEDAPRQSTFGFLPLGLLTDEADRAQFSHLLEHMLIRGTDPDTLEAPGIALNGETTGTCLRLDTYAEPDRWEAALDRHALWLAMDGVADEVLEREKRRIESEEESTVARGATHKWALAAWNQIVRHGRAHASVRGDVAAATSRDVLEYARRHLAGSRGVLVASVGPVDPVRIRERLVAQLEALGATTIPDAPARGAEPARPTEVPAEATWDLSARHYLEWAPLPDRAPSDRVAGYAAVQLVNLALASDARLGASRAIASAAALPEGRVLILSAALDEGCSPDLAREVFDDALAVARKGAGLSLGTALAQLRAQAGMRPDPAPARRQLERAGRDASLIEAQLLLNAIDRELGVGLEHDELLQAWHELDAHRLGALLEDLEKDGSRASLLLRPS